MEYDPLLLSKIIEVINLRVRPSLQIDGGDISVVSLTGNMLSVKMQGACQCCPRVNETLQFGVEQVLKQLVSKEIEVIAV